MRPTLPIPLAIAATMGTVPAVLLAVITNNTTGWPGVLFITVVGALLTLIVFWVARHRQRYWQSQLSSDSPSSEFAVYVGGMFLGRITTETYAEIRLLVMQNPRVGYQQIWNGMRVIWIGLQRLVVAIPLQFFWVGAILAIFAPEDAIDIAESIQEVGVATAVYTLSALMPMITWVGIALLGLLALTGHSCGFKDCYRAEAYRIAAIHVGADLPDPENVYIEPRGAALQTFHSE